MLPYTRVVIAEVGDNWSYLTPSQLHRVGVQELTIGSIQCRNRSMIRELLKVLRLDLLLWLSDNQHGFAQPCEPDICESLARETGSCCESHPQDGLELCLND